MRICNRFKGYLAIQSNADDDSPPPLASFLGGSVHSAINMLESTTGFDLDGDGTVGGVDKADPVTHRRSLVQAPAEFAVPPPPAAAPAAEAPDDAAEAANPPLMWRI